MTIRPSTDGKNPNNCGTCQHMLVHKGPGWCYMFRSEPSEECMHHTDLNRPIARGLSSSIKWFEIEKLFNGG